ncbi:MAG TPA: (Fe-S)-binding protein [Anaerolineae bacterium]|nr:(Fe-S)-binding protein [Anaerolineae bacterium]
MIPKPAAVQLFATCLVEAVCPQAGMAVVAVLEKLGLTVEYPQGQTCCGQPAFNAGAWDDARAMARHTLDVLSRSEAPIVVPSGSCADMMIHHYPELLAGDPKYGPLADSVARRTYEFTQFVVDVMGVSDVGARFEGKVAYHPSCHLLRGLGIREAPRQLLAHIQGAEVVELTGAEECCGFGGMFAVKMSDISGAMLRRKLDHIEKCGAHVVVGCDVSCLMHIGGGLHRRGSAVATRYLAELLVNQRRRDEG